MNINSIWILNFTWVVGFLCAFEAMASKKTTPTWTDDQLRSAIKEVSDGVSSVRAAAIKYGIPKSSLHDHLTGKSTKRFGGPRTIIPHEVEKEIVASCITLQEFGFPMTKEIVSTIIRDYLRESSMPNPFTNDTPGRCWWDGFLGRWPILKQRKPQHLPKVRALSTTPEVGDIECMQFYYYS